MKYTKNFNLNKPEQGEFYDVDDFNDNADKIDTALMERLPLAGGTMSGQIIQTQDVAISRSVNNASIHITGSKNSNEGGCLTLFGKESTEYQGCFALNANDKNDNYYQLVGKPDGKLTWGGKHIVRSVNGIDADVNGNVDIARKFYNSWAQLGLSNLTVTWDTLIEAMGQNASFCVHVNNTSSSNSYHVPNLNLPANISGALFVDVFRKTTPVNIFLNAYGTLYKSHYVVLASGEIHLEPWKIIPTSINGVLADKNGNISLPIATSETYGLVKLADDAAVLSDDNDEAAITPAVYHDVSDFRHKETKYKVGDRVECMFNSELFLLCVKAGTTSSDPLDTRNVKHGQTILDGTVQWKVWTHIKTVNGVVAGANGDVQIPAGEAVGFETICFSNNIPAGYLPYKGAFYTRSTYADLWKWAQNTGRVKTEAEWQALYKSQNGNVPYYSDGDGKTTFRVPNIKGWTKADSTAGNYLSAGLPNITGALKSNTQGGSPFSRNQEGLFVDDISAYTNHIALHSPNYQGMSKVKFDASYSNSIYGNADTVQPEGVTVIYIVKAYGVVNNVGDTDVSDLAVATQRVETELSSHIHVVEMYRNGTEWYRKWSDGWIEQGGIVPTTSINFIVTFQVPFADTNYTLTTTGDYSWNQVNNAVQSYSTTQFSGLYQKQVIDFRWYACGMGAE